MSEQNNRVPVGSIQKFSIEDGPGIRTTVFLKGCPLSCLWCHNPELISEEQQLMQSPNNCISCGHCVEICPHSALAMNEEGRITVNRDRCDVCLRCADECYAQALRPVAKAMTASEILDIVEQDKSFYTETGGGLTISGGELLMHADSVIELIEEAGLKGINVCLDTSGFGDSASLMTMALKENVTDILYDIKSLDDRIHRKYTGAGNKLIIDNLVMLASDDRVLRKVTVRMPLIGGVNDGEEIIKRTGDFLKEIGLCKVSLLPYHNLGVRKQNNIGGEQREFNKPETERLKEIELYFREKIDLNVEVLGMI